MFAGPNGSGKSTLKAKLSPAWLGVYINADEIEKSLREQSNRLELSCYGITFSLHELIAFFQGSTLAQKAGLLEDVSHFDLKAGVLSLGPREPNSYLAAVVADFIRRKLLALHQSFSFETVMSSQDKIELLRQAQQAGYRTYLYFVATEDPAINISRVALRVQQGGHDVPEQKIIERYQRSLNNLMDAIRSTNRAYVFDNSGTDLLFLAAIENGKKSSSKSMQSPSGSTKPSLAEPGQSVKPDNLPSFQHLTPGVIYCAPKAKQKRAKQSLNRRRV